MPVEDRAGFPVSWDTRGEGSAPTLMIHCTLGRSGMLRPLADAVSDIATTTLFDLPGHGRSGAWDSPDDPTPQSTAIAETFLGTEKTHLVGHSFGGAVAFRLAMQSPARVASLTLIEPVLFSAAERADADVYATYMEKETIFVDALRQGDLDGAARGFCDTWQTGMAYDALDDRTRAHFRKTMGFVGATEAFLMRESRALVTPDALLRLEDVPVLLVQGAKSPPIVSAIHKGLAAGLPHATQVTVEGAGHMVPLTHADAVAEPMRRVLRAGQDSLQVT